MSLLVVMIFFPIIHQLSTPLVSGYLLTFSHHWHPSFVFHWDHGMLLCLSSSQSELQWLAAWNQILLCHQADTAGFWTHPLAQYWLCCHCSLCVHSEWQTNPQGGPMVSNGNFALHDWCRVVHVTLASCPALQYWLRTSENPLKNLLSPVSVYTAQTNLGSTQVKTNPGSTWLCSHGQKP